MNPPPLPSDSVPPPLPTNPEAATHFPAPPPPLPEADENTDPLTGERGAHPFGVGIGAASTAVVGAALGSIAGPVGVVAGTAVGALAGGLLGKEAAEAVNPTPPSDPLEISNASAAATADALDSGRATRLRKYVLPQSKTIIARTSYPEEEVRLAAYYLYLHRRDQGLPGDEVSDWVEAEKQLLPTA